MNRLTWDEHIKRATAKGKFSRTAKTLVEAWPTCSVGEKLTATHPDEFVSDVLWNHQEAGKELRELGYQFTQAVNSDNIIKARKLHKAIKRFEI